MSKFTPDFEPKGIVKPNLITIVGFYITAAFLVITCPILCKLVTEDKGFLIAVFIGGAVVFALLAFLLSKVFYYWDDEQITIVQPMQKPVTYKFEELVHAQITFKGGVILYFNDKKSFSMEGSYTGVEEFKTKLREISD